jgi:molecular chaperone DnaJ
MGFSGFDFGDFFTNAAGRAGQGQPSGGGFGGGSFRDLFSQFFGRQQAEQYQSQPERGADLEYAHTVDFWSAVRGSQQRLVITRQEACTVCGGSGQSGGSAANCPQCDGTGQVSQMAGAMRFNLTCPRCGGSGQLRNACAACHGDGRIARNETIEVRIPAGARNGSRLRVAGKGSAGTQGMPPGDLFITLRVEEHPVFRRDGDNIELRVPITVWEAGLGTKIEVPTIDGPKTLKIPPGTQNGQKFRMREKGVLNSRTNHRGDQIVEVSLIAPNTEDERTRQLLRELARIHPEDPRKDLWTPDMTAAPAS